MFKCDCKLFERTGIACAHIFKVIICLGKSIMMGIDERWKISEEVALKLKEKAITTVRRGPPKETRRNTMK